MISALRAARGYVDDALRAPGGSLRSGVENPMDGPSGRYAPYRDRPHGFPPLPAPRPHTHRPNIRKVISSPRRDALGGFAPCRWASPHKIIRRSKKKDIIINLLLGGGASPAMRHPCLTSYEAGLNKFIPNQEQVCIDFKSKSSSLIDKFCSNREAGVPHILRYR